MINFFEKRHFYNLKNRKIPEAARLPREVLRRRNGTCVAWRLVEQFGEELPYRQP